MNCFVIMPLTDEMKPLYDEGIVPAVKSVFSDLWECIKADDQRKPGMVTGKIVNSLLNADVVIAVIADMRKNPINANVMYELGVAHSFRKPTIVVADKLKGLPFDLKDIESILVDIKKILNKDSCRIEMPKFRDTIQAALKPFADILKKNSDLPSTRNPVSINLTDYRIFIEDLPWLWGYKDVFEREYNAKTVWEITPDLFWPTEVVFFESVKEGIRRKRKHYFLVPKNEEVMQKAGSIVNQLKEEGLPEDEITDHLKFTTIEGEFFELLPIPVVLYDANLATLRDGIICEPMQSEVGHDAWDETMRKRFADRKEYKELRHFLEYLKNLDWIEKRQETTFDIRLDRRTVDYLAIAFRRLWNEKINQEAETVTDQADRDAFKNTWLIK